MIKRLKKSTAFLLVLLTLSLLLNSGAVLAGTGTANYDESSFRAIFKDVEFANSILYTMGQNIYNVNWSKVNDESLGKITGLSLDGNINNLDGLEKLTGLKSLNIIDTNIQGFPAGVENNLTNLSYLNLKGNENPIFIPKFTTLTNLSCTGFSGQALDIRSKDSIQAMENLQYLDLSALSPLTGLLDYSKFKGLQSLNISSSNLDTIPEGIMSLPSLVSLYMEGNNLSRIPDKLVEYAKNQNIIINLSCNFLDSVDPSVSNKIIVSNPRRLSFSNLPDTISTAYKINLIDYLNYGFYLKKYEFGISSVSQPESTNASISEDGVLSVNVPGTYNITAKLKGADINNTQAVAKASIVALDPSDPIFYNNEKMEREFPDPVFREYVLNALGQRPDIVDWSKVNKASIGNLSQLFLSGNIEKLDGLEKLTGLQDLSLTGTKIQGFPAGIENNLKNLNSLSLTNNKNSLYIPKFASLTSLFCGISGQAISGQALDIRSKDSIQAMENLQKLDISGQNQFAGLLDYSKYKILRSLDISSCNLDSIPESIMKLPSLQYLYINDNNLSVISDKLIEYTKNHYTLIFMDNNFLNSVDPLVSYKIFIQYPKSLAFLNLPGTISTSDKINLIGCLNYRFSPEKYVFDIASADQPGSTNASISENGILSVNAPGTYNITVRLKDADTSNINAVAKASIVVSKRVGLKIYDLNNDGYINMNDIVLVASAFNSIRSSAKYKAEYDFNNDGAINMTDIIMIAGCFNMPV